MSEETEPTEVEVEQTDDATPAEAPEEPTETPNDPETPEQPEQVEQASPPPPPPPQPQAQQGPDIDALFSEKEALATKLEAGEITYEQYTKQTVAVDRKITAAQRAIVQPVAAAMNAQEQARAYWANWGKGSDIAQVQYKSIPAAKAKDLYQKAIDSVTANPRYKNRPEMDTSTIVYDKFMDLLEAERGKKPAPAAASTTQPRASGRAGAAPAPAPTKPMTAREKLAAGHYDQGIKSVVGD